MKIKKNETLYAILFSIFAIVLSFGVGEATIRLISNYVMIYNIEMLKYGSELKMRDPLKEVSHIHRPNSSAQLMGVNISLNSMGNRSRELINPKAIDEKRIYVAGSSVTMGWGVPENKVFSYLAEENLNRLGTTKYNFINAGVGNYGTYSSTRLFYRQFKEANPDMVVLHYFIADAEPRDLVQNNFWLQQTYLGAYFYNDIRGLIFRNRYNSLFDYYDQLYQNDSLAWQQTQNDILHLKTFLAEKRIPLFIMIVPDFHNLSENSQYRVLYQKMQSAFAQMSIPTLNAFPEFQKLYGNKENLLWVQPNDPHPNAAGHKVMADLLYNYFLKNVNLDVGP